VEYNDVEGARVAATQPGKGEHDMRLDKTAVLAMLTVTALIIPAIAAGQDFKIVINEANAISSISKDDLSRCFMKQANIWISGQQVIPVDQAASSDTRQAFSGAVHGRDVSAVKSFWQRQIFSGRGVPPAEKASDQEVLAFVRANPGAVGYVSADADVSAGVKVLEITDL
jgi:ABC-type phosphate transport system substrate-binding protein